MGTRGIHRIFSPILEIGEKLGKISPIAGAMDFPQFGENSHKIFPNWELRASGGLRPPHANTKLPGAAGPGESGAAGNRAPRPLPIHIWGKIGEKYGNKNLTAAILCKGRGIKSKTLPGDLVEAAATSSEIKNCQTFQNISVKSVDIY